MNLKNHMPQQDNAQKNVTNILERVIFDGKRVLELGTDEGCAAEFVVDNGASEYVGVNTGQATVKVSRHLLAKNQPITAQFHCRDPLVFVTEHTENKNHTNKFDIVLMLGFFEHFPRSYLKNLLIKLEKCLAAQAVIVVDTPARRTSDCTTSDEKDAHSECKTCDAFKDNEYINESKYSMFTIPSLESFMMECGYAAISEMHFFIPRICPKMLIEEIFPYQKMWRDAYISGFPVKEEWAPDLVDYTYDRETIPEWHDIKHGPLSGVRLFTSSHAANRMSDAGFEQAMLEHMAKVNLQCKTIFDVGGYIGVTALLFATLAGPKGRVVSFEPNPWNTIRIRQNFSANADVAKRIGLYPLALGSERGESAALISSNIDVGHSSASRLNEARMTISQPPLREIGFEDARMCVVTLDEFVEETGIVPQVLKIDVEGAEHLTLQGALRTIEKYNPCIYVEFHSPFCTFACLRILHNFGYVSELINEERDGRLLIYSSRG